MLPLSDALKQFFATWERRTWKEPPCAKAFPKAFKIGFVDGYSACFAEGFGIDWSKCPADLDVLRQVVLARNRAQHSDLVLDHLAHDEKSRNAFPRLFFIRPEDEGPDASEGPFLSPLIHISREKLLEAIDQTERLGSWVQQCIEARGESARLTLTGEPSPPATKNA